MKQGRLSLLRGVVAAVKLAAQRGMVTSIPGDAGQTSVQPDPDLGAGIGARGMQTVPSIGIYGRIYSCVIEDGSALAPNTTIQGAGLPVARTTN